MAVAISLSALHRLTVGVDMGSTVLTVGAGGVRGISGHGKNIRKKSLNKKKLKMKKNPKLFTQKCHIYQIAKWQF